MGVSNQHARTELFGQWLQGNFVVADMARGTGRRFWVDDSGTDSAGYGKSPDRPFKTIDFAIGQCTAGRGDIIYVLPGHAETVTAAITCDVSHVSIIGLGQGGQRPVITPNGTIDAVTVTAAGVTLENLEFAAPGTDAQTADINIAAAGCVVRNTLHHGSTTSKNKVDIITITAAGHNALIDGARIYNTTVEVVGGIILEGTAARVEIANCLILDAIGFTNGAIADEATATQVYIHHNTIMNAKAATVVLAFANNSTGVCAHNNIIGRHTTIASNVTAGTGMNFFENFVVEEAAKNGLYMPAQDAD